jgi:hypothetical protein
VENALYTYERFEESAANQFPGGAPIIATVGAFGFNCFPLLGGTRANCFVGITWFQIAYSSPDLRSTHETFSTSC